MSPDTLDQLCIDYYGISRTELNEKVIGNLGHEPRPKGQGMKLFRDQEA